MASIITIRLKYTDNSRSLTEDFPCADSHPSAAVLQDCERDLLKRWEALGGKLRGLETHVKVRAA